MRVFLPAAAICAALLLASCARTDTHQQVAADMIQRLEELNTILDSIQDEPSAKAAEPKLDRVTDEMIALKARGEALDEPTPEQRQALQQEYEPKLQDLMGRMMKNMMRLSLNPQLARHIQGPLQKLAGSMQTR